MKYFYWGESVESVKDDDIKQLLNEIHELRSDIFCRNSRSTIASWLQAVYLPWPSYKFTKIENKHITTQVLLKTSVGKLIDSNIYKLLRDMAKIAEDNPENHHKKHLYQVMNILGRKIFVQKHK